MESRAEDVISSNEGNAVIVTASQSSESPKRMESNRILNAEFAR